MPYYKYKRICQNCGREYLVREYRSSKYCHSCRKDLGLVKNQAKYSGHFYRNRKIILNRDRERCRNCKSIKKLVIHHIDCDKKNNSLSNLITLCTVCHLGLHRIYSNKELREGNISTLFSKMNLKKIQEKIDFLKKLKDRIRKKKPKKFIGGGLNGK